MHGRCRTLFLLGLFVLALSSPARAQLASVEAGKMLLVYVDGTQSFLVPHAARTFLNSLSCCSTCRMLAMPARRPSRAMR